MKRSVSKTGADRIAAERIRQTVKLGWFADHDDEHASGELAMAAVCYAAPERVYAMRRHGENYSLEDPWPWDFEWDKRPARTPTTAQRIRLLEKAGALIAAEIDRLLRLKRRK